MRELGARMAAGAVVALWLTIVTVVLAFAGMILMTPT